MVGRRMTSFTSGKKKIQYKLYRDYTYHDLPWSNIKVHTVMLLRIQVWYNKYGFCTSKIMIKYLNPSNKYLIWFLGEYSCLKVELIFKREFSYYLITIYVPCCMLVIVSWVSFWLDQNAIPARVSLGVTTLLTMSTQVNRLSYKSDHSLKCGV